LQIVLAMIEAERVDHRLLLEDPLDAVRRWSHDPTLAATALTCSGQRLTAVEHQRRFFERAKEFVDGGACDGIVPDAAHLLEVWDETLTLLEAKDLPALATRLDWALKLSLLERVRRERGLGWNHAAMRHLDQLYASLDPDEG